MEQFRHNQSSQSSDARDDSFIVRWRGKQQGPYSADQIDEMLESNQIGLLHEISYCGEWLTIRDFMARKEAAIRQQLEAEEALRLEQEELERVEREREERRKAERLAEQKQKTAQLEAEVNRQRQAMQSQPNIPSRSSGSSSLRRIGILLLLGGLGVTAFFFLGFDTSVESGMGRINNIGLMADRQNGILIGLGLAIVGTIMLVIGSRESN